MAESSNMTRDWIERVWAKNPCAKLANGEIRTGPMRAAFCNLIDRPKPGKDGKERSHGVVLLVPDMSIPSVNIDILYDEAAALFQEKAPAAMTNPELRARYHNPFKKQETFIDLKTGELYEGFTPGRIAISANSPGKKPIVYNQRQQIIIDKDLVYSGCWVIAGLNPAWIPREDKKGPTFYLQWAIVVADDENLSGSGVTAPAVAFAGVQIDAEVNPAGMFSGGEDKEAAARRALFGE